MHELSVMTQVIDAVRRIAEEKGAQRVVSVHLQVGELTFLAEEQMRFAFEILAGQEAPLMEGAKLTIEPIRARGSCPACGFVGELTVVEMEDSHFTTPTLDCPECGKLVEVTEGKDLLIRDINMEVPDDGEADGDD